MKRIIKFRVYSKDTKEMFQPHAFIEDYQKRDDVVLMQYTGLKDINGIEVYEGDTIKYNNRKYNVKWHIDRFGMQNPKSSDYLWFDNYSKRARNDNSEIIGNIYENNA